MSIDSKLKMFGVSSTDLEALKNQIKYELARRDFWEFCKLVAPLFYKDDRPHLIRLCKELQQFYESNEEKVMIINVPPRHGKLVADYEDVLTTKGWKKHGKLQVGDEVFSPTGKAIKVEAVMPKAMANCRVTFSNGQTLDVHENHEWVVYDRKLRREVIVETKDFFNSVVLNQKSQLRYRYLLPVCLPIEGKKRYFKVEPYDFALNMPDEIPYIYLTSSLSQRLDLLAGFLDDLGGICPNTRRYYVTTNNIDLRDDLVSLISTFGWKARTKTNRNSWTIHFSPTMEIPCKKAKNKLGNFYRRSRTSVADVIKLDKPTQGNCITVEGGLYLVGRQLIPTHNSRTAQLFTQWIFGKNKNEKILTGSYNEQLSTTFSRGVRDSIGERKGSLERVVYSDIFPDVKLKKGSSASNMWSLDGTHISYLATSPGGTVTGFGGSIIIIDDIVKNAEEAYNETILENIWTWYTNTMLSRLESGGKVIIIATRWHSDDLSGRAIRHYEKIGVPIRVITEKALQDDGSMLCSDILDRGSYETIKSTMGTDILMANYNQQPVDMVGRLYQGFKTYSEYPKTDDGKLAFEQICAYVDTADKGNDYLCAYIFGIYKNQAYIIDAYFTKDGMEITEPELAKRLAKYKVQKAWIESNNGGRGFARSVERILREKHRYYGCFIEMFFQGKNKKARILGASTWVQENVIFPVGWEHNWAELYNDLYRYQKEGRAKHDDAEDALSGIYEKMGRGSLYSFE